MENNVMAIVLAAGKGTRMKTNKAKVVHKIFDKELVVRVVESAENAGIKDIITVVGHKREEVQKVLGDRVKYAYQNELLGTGHTVMQAIPFLKGKEGKVVILYGDVPLIHSDTIEKLVKKSIVDREYATILTAVCNNPSRIWKGNKRYWRKCKSNS